MPGRDPQIYVQQNVEQPSFRPAGGTKPIEPIRGLDAYVSTMESATLELRKVARELQVMNDRSAQMAAGAAIGTGSTATSGIAGGLGGGMGMPYPLMNQLVGSVVSQEFSAMGLNVGGSLMQTAPPGVPTRPAEHRSALATGPKLDQPPPAHRAHSDERHRQAARTSGIPTRVAPGSYGDDTPHDPSQQFEGGMGYAERVRYAKGIPTRSVSDMRSRFMQGVGRMIQNHTPNLQPIDFGGHTPAYTPVRPPGFAGPIEPASTEGALGGQVGRFQMGKGAMNAVGAIGEGESPMAAIGGLLPEGALGAASGVGAALVVGQQIGHQFESQRAANAQFQSIMGGSNLAAFGERARQKGFALSQFGTMGAGEASKLYSETTALGLKGGQRQESLDFAVREYKNLGMSIDDSMKIIKTASETGQTALGGVSKALDNVTKAAKSAGVNTEFARQRFIADYQAWSGMFGQGATLLAGASATAMAGQGRVLQNVDTSQEYSQDRLRILGAQSGRSYNQMLALGGGSQQDQLKLAQMSGAQQRQVSSMLVHPQGQQIIAQYMQSKGLKAGQGLSDAQVEEVGNQMLGNPQAMADIGAALPIIQRFAGDQVQTPQQAVEWLVRQQTGQLNPGAQAAKDVVAGQQRTVGRGAQVNAGRGNNAYNVGRRTGLSREDAMLTGADLKTKIGETTGATHDRLIYEAGTQKTGRTSGLVESLLSKGNYDAERRFKVKGPDGKDRVVTTGDLVKYYSGQAASGKVDIVAGSGAGTTLSEALHMQGDPNAKGDTNRGAGGKAAAKAGTDYATWQKHQDKDQGRSGKVLIQPTPELARFLQFLPSGGATVDPNVGRTPPASQTMPETLPTG